jgi:hypothetical protein
MHELLFWLYLLNLVLLILHEMDSAYWKEWLLFGLPGDIGGFLLIHIPLLAVGLYGLVLVYREVLTGWILSLVFSLGGIFAFCIHTYFLRQGRSEFNTPVSKGVLWATLVMSVAQLMVTLNLLLS